MILATGPFPFYYGYGPSDQPGPADPLLPALGLPIQVNFEQPPPGIVMQRYTNQSILLSVPTVFPFPPGDQRLRAVNRTSVSSANRYLPLIKAVVPQGTDYGDAAAFIAFGTGPANGGKILYIWSTLLTGPQGDAIMIDTVSWIVNATLRPPRPNFGAILLPDKHSRGLQLQRAVQPGLSRSVPRPASMPGTGPNCWIYRARPRTVPSGSPM